MNNQIENLPSLPGVYQIVNKTNLRVYIGQSVNIKARMQRHLSLLNKNKHDNLHLQNAWNAYGEQNFFFGVLKIVHDQDKRNDEEQMWIDILFGERSYNFKKSVVRMADEIRQSISKSKLGKKLSEETRKKLSLIRRGKPQPSRKGKAPPNKGKKTNKPAWNKGKPMPEEQKQKMREAKLGKPSPNKGKPGKPPWNKGKKLNKPPWNKGKPMSPEQKAKLSLARKKMFEEKRVQAAISAALDSGISPELKEIRIQFKDEGGVAVLAVDEAGVEVEKIISTEEIVDLLAL